MRADVRGRDAVMAWQTDHRVNSPYPLRHNGTNVHVVRAAWRRGRRSARTSSSPRSPAGASRSLSTAIVTGTVRRVGDAVVIAELEVVLDTRDSVLFSDR